MIWRYHDQLVAPLALHPNDFVVLLDSKVTQYRNRMSPNSTRIGSDVSHYYPLVVESITHGTRYRLAYFNGDKACTVGVTSIKYVLQGHQFNPRLLGTPKLGITCQLPSFCLQFIREHCTVWHNSCSFAPCVYYLHKSLYKNSTSSPPRRVMKRKDPPGNAMLQRLETWSYTKQWYMAVCSSPLAQDINDYVCTAIVKQLLVTKSMNSGGGSSSTDHMEAWCPKIICGEQWQFLSSYEDPILIDSKVHCFLLDFLSFFVSYIHTHLYSMSWLNSPLFQRVHV
jgi:hypothetical protein